MNISGFDNVRDLSKQIQNDTQGEPINNKLGTNNVNTPIDDDISMYNKGVDFMTYGNYYVQTEGIFDKKPKMGTYRPPITDDDINDGPSFFSEKEKNEMRKMPRMGADHQFGQGGKYDYNFEQLKQEANPVLKWMNSQPITTINFSYDNTDHFIDQFKNNKHIPEDSKTENFVNFVKEYGINSYDELKSVMSSVEFLGMKSSSEHTEAEKHAKETAEYEQKKEAELQAIRDEKRAKEKALKEKGLDNRSEPDRREDNSNRRV